MKEASLEDLYRIYQQHPNISKDTRQIESGCLYFALKGESFDGNQFAEEAIQKGAAYAVIDNPTYQKNDRCLLVKDVLSSLQQLANYHRKQLNIPVLAISGSNGKTTTKELIATTLRKKYKVLFTNGNYNNHIGVPLTLLRITPEHEIAIIEMGANHQGEIDQLCRIAEPNYGMLTNIGKAHLEGFGGIEGVKKGKTEMFRFIEKNNGHLFINLDDQAIKSSVQSKNITTYSIKTDADCNGSISQSHPHILGSWKCINNKGSIHSSLYGEYNFHNIIAAVCIANYFKVEAKLIDEAIAEYHSDMNRSQILKKGTHTFFLDAYNANPSSMKLAVTNFNRVDSPQKVMILGDMFELGESASEEHLAILELALSQDTIQTMVFVGRHFSQHKERFKASLFFETTEEAKNWFETSAKTGSTVLLKGSRGMKLEQIVA